MISSGKTLLFFGIYAMLAGFSFILFPDKLTSILQLPPVPEAWANIIGLLGLVIGSYDIYCGKANIQPFIKVSVFVRFGFFIATVLLFATKQMPVGVILFGSVDAIGAIWTYLSLKAESAKQ